jgi:predicted secreted Zn-dependent protease
VGLVISPTTTTHFDLDVPTLADVVASLQGRDEAGHCDWAFLPWESSGVTRDGTAREINLTIQITIEMPRWTHRDTARAAERTEWDRFYEALRQHEAGHEQIVRGMAPAMHAKLMQTRIRDLNRVFEAERQKIQDRSNAYDTRTRHGLNPPPGTLITVPAGP